MLQAHHRQVNTQFEQLRAKLEVTERSQETGKAGMERLRRQCIETSHKAGMKVLAQVFRRHISWHIHLWKEAVDLEEHAKSSRAKAVAVSHMAGMAQLRLIASHLQSVELGRRIGLWCHATTRANALQLQASVQDGIEAKVRWRAAALTTQGQVREERLKLEVGLRMLKQLMNADLHSHLKQCLQRWLTSVHQETRVLAALRMLRHIWLRQTRGEQGMRVEMWRTSMKTVTLESERSTSREAAQAAASREMNLLHQANTASKKLERHAELEEAVKNIATVLQHDQDASEQASQAARAAHEMMVENLHKGQQKELQLHGRVNSLQEEIHQQAELFARLKAETEREMAKTLGRDEYLKEQNEKLQKVTEHQRERNEKLTNSLIEREA